MRVGLWFEVDNGRDGECDVGIDADEYAEPDGGESGEGDVVMEGLRAVPNK